MVGGTKTPGWSVESSLIASHGSIMEEAKGQAKQREQARYDDGTGS
jgi:hypothetical protein